VPENVASACIEQARGVWEFVTAVSEGRRPIPFFAVESPRDEFVLVVGSTFEGLLQQFLAGSWVAEHKHKMSEELRAHCSAELKVISSEVRRFFTHLPELVRPDGSIAGMDIIDRWLGSEIIGGKVFADAQKFVREEVGDTHVLWQLCGLKSASDLIKSLAKLLKHASDQKGERSLTDDTVTLLSMVRQDTMVVKQRLDAQPPSDDTRALWTSPTPFGVGELLDSLADQTGALMDTYRGWFTSDMRKFVEFVNEACPACWVPNRDRLLSLPEVEQTLFTKVGNNIGKISVCIQNLILLITNLKKLHRDGLGFMIAPELSKRGASAKLLAVESMCTMWALYEYRSQVQIENDLKTRNCRIKVLRSTMRGKNVPLGADLDEALQKADREDFVALDKPAVSIPKGDPPAPEVARNVHRAVHTNPIECVAPAVKRRRKKIADGRPK